MTDMIETFTHAAEQPGPKLLITGAIHGNETCGPVAINRVLKEIDEGKLKITCGQVTFVPVCNPRAYAENVRFIERNLNRYLVPMAKPDTYEAQLGNILCPMLADCDVLLDIHSTPSGGKPYVFVGPHNPKEYAFAASLGTRWLMTGWEETYANTGRKTETTADVDEGIGTEQVVRMRGKIAALIECGDHNDQAAFEVAYQAIHNALTYLQMTDEKPSPVLQSHLITMSQVYYRTDAGEMTRHWQDFDSVKKGDLIAKRKSGEELRAPADGLVILPHVDADIGQEWFYFGTEAAL